MTHDGMFGANTVNVIERVMVRSIQTLFGYYGEPLSCAGRLPDQLSATEQLLGV